MRAATGCQPLTSYHGQISISLHRETVHALEGDVCVRAAWASVVTSAAPCWAQVILVHCWGRVCHAAYCHVDIYISLPANTIRQGKHLRMPQKACFDHYLMENSLLCTCSVADGHQDPLQEKASTEPLHRKRWSTSHGKGVQHHCTLLTFGERPAPAKQGDPPSLYAAGLRSTPHSYALPLRGAAGLQLAPHFLLLHAVARQPCQQQALQPGALWSAAHLLAHLQGMNWAVSAHPLPGITK